MLVTGFGDFPIRMDFDLFATARETSLILTKTSTLLVIDTTQGPMGSGGFDTLGVFTFTGFGVRYDSDSAPIAGTITGMKFTDQLGQVTFNVSGLSLPAAPFYQAIDGAINHGIPANVLALLLPGNDEFRGTAGDDLIIDYAGHNIFMGGDGRDSIAGGDGNDHIYGQSPSGGEDGGDALTGGGGSDYIQGNAGQDNLDGGDGSDRLNGGQGVDFIFGRAGNDTINGNRDSDDISGGDGNDLLRGGQGNDILRGDDGNDIIMGDRGADEIDGGSGADLFVFRPGTSEIGSTTEDIDRLAEFRFDEDHISLGFVPQTILHALTTDDDVPRTLEAARAFAQAQFNQHAGDHEVAIVHVSFGSPLFFWSSTGGSTIDSVVQIGSTGNSTSHLRDNFDFLTNDFV